MLNTKKIVAIAVLFVASGLTSSARVRVEGNRFFRGDNQIFMLGTNTPWNSWNEFGQNFDSGWWENHFRKLSENGLNNTRVWISCSGENQSPVISEDGFVSGATVQFWQDVDQLFHLAKQHNIYLMVALISFDHTRTDGDWGERWRKMYSSEENRKSYIDNYVKPFIERYRKNNYFWAVDVVNEIEWVFEDHGVKREYVVDLIARVANAVRETSDGEVLVTQGLGAGPKFGSPVFEGNMVSDDTLGNYQPGAHLDFYKIHYYDWQRQWFGSPFEMGPGDWQIDYKPCIIGEYGASGAAEFSPEECLLNSVSLGWQGVQPWTSNGVDGYGSIDEFGTVFKFWSTQNHELVFPPQTENPGPFTIDILQSEGGMINVDPVKKIYQKNEKVIVTALPEDGNELRRWGGGIICTSTKCTVVVNENLTLSAHFATSGDLISNGSFYDGELFWSLGRHGGAAADVYVDRGTFCISIADPGSQMWHLQLTQGGLFLEAGRSYEFSFSTRAESNRSMYVALGEDGGNYDKYAERTVSLTEDMRTFTINFITEKPDSNVRVEFNMGAEAGDVYLNDVSLRFTDVSSVVKNNVNQTFFVPKPISGYRFENGLLKLKGVNGDNVSVDGYALNGKHLFSWNGKAVGEKVSIPVNVSSFNVMVIKGTVDDRDVYLRVINRN
ncbi:Endo-1,4-beta-glucanase [Chitinispirillum alkaliphilum]|nr:Endo-1,4-beta-glucanase [Chitinispirillum alkaliphilum]